jgi:hypothetical protein
MTVLQLRLVTCSTIHQLADTQQELQCSSAENPNRAAAAAAPAAQSALICSYRCTRARRRMSQNMQCRYPGGSLSLLHCTRSMSRPPTNSGADATTCPLPQPQAVPSLVSAAAPNLSPHTPCATHVTKPLAHVKSSTCIHHLENPRKQPTTLQFCPDTKKLTPELAHPPVSSAGSRTRRATTQTRLAGATRRLQPSRLSARLCIGSTTCRAPHDKHEHSSPCHHGAPA